MSSDLERLSTRRLKDFAQVEALYRTRLKKDFVRNELKPLISMRRSWEKNAYDCYGLYDGEKILGYAFFVRLGSSALLDYLAIAEEHRGEGLGTVFLRQLRSCLRDADCVLVAVEDPEKAGDGETRTQRERRRQFYLRSGWRETGLCSAVFGADYRILEIPMGKEHSTEQLRRVYTELYRSCLPSFFFRTRFRVWQSFGRGERNGDLFDK